MAEGADYNASKVRCFACEASQGLEWAMAGHDDENPNLGIRIRVEKGSDGDLD